MPAHSRVDLRRRCFLAPCRAACQPASQREPLLIHLLPSVSLWAVLAGFPFFHLSLCQLSAAPATASRLLRGRPQVCAIDSACERLAFSHSIQCKDAIEFQLGCRLQRAVIANRCCSKELDSELLEAKSTVKGVLTADGDGLVLKGERGLEHSKLNYPE